MLSKFALANRDAEKIQEMGKRNNWTQETITRLIDDMLARRGVDREKFWARMIKKAKTTK